MSIRSIRPQSALVGALAATAVFSALGMQRTGSAERLVCLTPEQEEILGHLSIVYLDDGSGAPVNKTIRIEGVNVQIVNGLGSTETINGTGNLVIGYNEPYDGGDDRTGSHCIVVGSALDYSSYGGQVMGYRNTIEGEYASALGGWRNEASGQYALVSGGSFSTAGGDAASVFGGHNNFAFGPWTTVAGGHINTALGTESTIAGGWLNTAQGAFSSVSGGKRNDASGECATVAGGQENSAAGDFSAVSGGNGNEALDEDATVSGGCANATSAACDHVP